MTRKISQRYHLPKRKWWGPQYINQKHMSVEIIVRIILGVTILVYSIYCIDQFGVLPPFLTLFITPSLIVSADLVRAWFERYRSSQPEQAYITCVGVGGGYLTFLMIYLTLRGY